MKLHPIQTSKALYMLITLLGLTASVLFAVGFEQKTASAVSGWSAGNIISDPVFTNKNTMSSNDIQYFLESKVPSCDTWGVERSEFGGGTRRQWAESRGHSAPFTCLKDYSENGKRASQIIYDTAQRYSINPQVLIVLLQKEQSLITDTWPLEQQYRTATGYGCPDTAPCDSQYYGLSNQLGWAARMFRAIVDDSPTWYTPYILGNNFIRYSPDATCGGSNVTIENRATQALYNYTPYQPNQGALIAGWGTASCGAYGNRNFYLYFTNWFGSTQDLSRHFTALDNPRWMRVKNVTQKTNLSTSLRMTDNTLSAGQQIRFVDKIYINNTWYLRTEFDRNNGNLLGVSQSDLEEISYENLPSAQWMTLTKSGNKSHPSSRTYAEPLMAGASIRFTQKITVNGVTYLRTEHDSMYGNELGVISTQLSEFQFIPLDTPTYMNTNEQANKIDVLTKATNSTIDDNTSLKLEGKALINGIWYYQQDDDFKAKNRLAVDSAQVSRNEKTRLKGDLTLTIPGRLQKYNLHNLQKISNNDLSLGQKVIVSHSIVVDSQLYYITKFDNDNGNYQGILAKELLVPLDVPRIYTSIQSTNKIRLSDLQNQDLIIKDQSIFFSTKIAINNNWCLRTQFDTQADNLLCVPIASLK